MPSVVQYFRSLAWWPLLVILGLALLNEMVEVEVDAYPDSGHFYHRILLFFTWSMVFFYVSYLLRRIKFLGVTLITLSSSITLIWFIECAFMLAAYSDVFFPSDSPDHIEAPPAPNAPSFSASTDPVVYQQHDYTYGFRNLESDTVEVSVMVNGQDLPKAYYVTDQFRRRINRRDTLLEADRFAMFIGCSMTFGQHVQEDATLPVYFQAANPGVRSYNYGISASGPHQYLAVLRDLDLREQIPEDKGVFFYSFFDGHVARAIGDYFSFQWNNHTPYYFLKGDSLVRDGNFLTGRPFRSWLYKWMYESYFVRAIQFNYPRELRPEDHAFTARIILEIKREVQRQLGPEPFYVILFPLSSDEIIQELDKLDIDHIDYRFLSGNSGEDELFFPLDNHPTAKFYRIMADSLSKDCDI